MMPKRVIHGEGVWSSDKLAAVQPEWVRPEYANLIPLALANGVFEVNAKRIWSSAYSFNRPEITVEKVQVILESFEAAGLLFTWNDQASRKTWGFWVGIDKPGRLPSASRLKKGHDSVGPTPPSAALKEYVQGSAISQWPTNGQLGSGSGSGSGNTSSSEADASGEQTQREKRLKELSPDAVELANLLHQKILGNNPNARISPAHVAKWAVDAERMIELDNRKEKQIREIIHFSQTDPFWHSNILSMGKLREKFDQLWLKYTGAVKVVPLHGPVRQDQLTEDDRAVYQKHGVAL